MSRRTCLSLGIANASIQFFFLYTTINIFTPLTFDLAILILTISTFYNYIEYTCFVLRKRDNKTINWRGKALRKLAGRDLNLLATISTSLGLSTNQEWYIAFVIVLFVRLNHHPSLISPRNVHWSTMIVVVGTPSSSGKLT